jgi:hypothetical protein
MTNGADATEWLIADDHPITTVSGRLGHAKPSITTDIYGHVVAATRDSGAPAVSSLLFAPGHKEQEMAS